MITRNRSDRSRTGPAIVFGTVAGGCAVALLGLSGWLLSRAAEHPPVLYLLAAVTCVRALGLGRGVFRYLERLSGHDTALALQGRLRATAFARLARSAQIGRRSARRLSTTLHDVDTVADTVVRLVLPVASAAVLVLATTTVLAVLSPATGLLVGLAAFGSAVGAPLAAAALSARADRVVGPARAALATAVVDGTHAARDLRAFGAEHVALDRLRTADRELARAERQSASARGLAATLQVLLLGGASLGALVVGARAVAEGTLAPALLAVLVLVPVALLDVVEALPLAAQVARRAVDARRRLDALDTLPVSGIGRTEVAGEAAGIVATDLVVGWTVDEPLTAPVSFRCRAGERVAVVGPSGVGKTTLAATVLGMLAPSAGTLRVGGRVGMLEQDAYVFDSTVSDNVAIGRPGAPVDEIEAALAAAALRLPLHRRVGPSGTSLSGGEVRRLALARLLLAAPDVVVLDEPTEHLDRETADRLVTDTFTAFADAAVLVITHDPLLQRRCDRLLWLDPTQEPVSTPSRAPTPAR